jgi:hypothetical protein
MKRIVAIGLALCAAISPAYADVTITSTVSSKVMGRDMGGQNVAYIKGTKMRHESQDRVFILDAASHQMIVLNDKKKEAEILDMAKIQADVQKAAGAGEPKVAFTPTGQKKTINGTSCDGYTLTITMPMTMGNQSMSITMTGPAWLAKGAPGSKDYAAFYLAAAKNGMFFGSVDQAKQQGAQIKSTTEMYRAFAAAGGMPYESEMEMKFEGTGPMADMMNKMGGMHTKTTVTAVSTETIPDSKFTVPPGYKTVTK